MKIQELALASVFLPSNNNDAPPGAWLGHIPFAGWIVEAMKPEILVELGTHYGDSFFAFCQAVRASKLSTQCYAVDTWQGDEHAGEYGNEVYDFVRRKHEAFASESSLLRMTFDDALAHFTDGTVDLLHIDGLHTYDAVKHDFETWKPKLSDRAVVLFHDTAVRQGDFGVWRYWEELIAQYPHIRFDHSSGLGVLFVGEKREPVLESLLQAWKEEGNAALIRQFFASMGERIEKDRRIAALEADGAARHEALLRLEEHGQAQHQHIVTLEQNAVVLHQRSAELENQVAAMDAHIKSLEAQLQAQCEHSRHVEARLDEVLASTSWRATAPLRKVSDFIRR